MNKIRLKHALVKCIVLAVLYTLSWIISCGFFKLITLCFGWTFSWKVATGIWIIICFVKLLLARGAE